MSVFRDTKLLAQLFTVGTLAYTGPVFAITNIESQRSAEAEQGLHGSVEVAISGKSGNSDTRNTATAGRIDWRRAEHQLMAIVSTEYEETNQQKSADNNFAHLRYIHHNTAHFAWESYLQYSDDAFKQLDSRALMGAGIRYSFAPEDNHRYDLILGIGAYYTEEVYNLELGGQLDEDYARASGYVTYSLQLSETAALLNTLYLQPRISQLSDVYIYNNFSLELTITGALALQVSLETQYDSEPVEDTKSLDHTYKTALVYKF